MDDFTKRLSDALIQYYKNDAEKHQRFGQYFVNYFLPREYTPWPELFYEKDTRKAVDLLIEKFSPLTS